jgi:catechol 2,3-dioxygenase-like lactoylglutathione lyase family enzyme
VSGVPDGIDHIVHAVRDLDAAGALYRRLGFTVGARNRHDWGTHNLVVQFPTAFVELLEIGEPEKIPPHRGRFFSFGAFNRDYIKSREGLSMLVGKSSDAREDAASFESAGISGFDVFDFTREGKRPDGSPVKVAFSLAFARDPSSPDLGFFVCQHHYPENFWNPDFQRHANGAAGIPGVVMVADNPTDHHIFLKAFTGVSDLHSSSLGVTARTGNGNIEIMSPTAFRDQFGTAPEVSGEGMTLNAICFAVSDIGHAEATLVSGGIKPQRHVGRLVVPPDQAFGATLIFQSANKA